MSETEKTALETKREELEAAALTANTARGEAKGTRLKVGSTRGKNPQAISFEAFDESLPATLPESLEEFMSLAKISDEKAIVALLVDGFNSFNYTAASDPIAEYVDATWSDEVQKQFRLVVRNYANATGISIDDAVALIKPGIVASQKKG